MTENVRIIEADLNNPQHRQAIVDLEDQYASGLLPGKTGLSDEVKENLIPNLQKFPTTLIFLAYLSEKPVGIAICFYGFSTFAARRLINVHDLAVHPDYQAQGIGRRLLQTVVHRAEAEHCCKVTLEVEENNQRARGLYRSLGFEQGIYTNEAGKQLFLTRTLGQEC